MACPDAEYVEEEVGGEDVVGFAGGPELAAIEDHDVVEAVGGAKVVEGDEQGGASAGETVGEGEDFERVAGVEGGEGFVPEL